MMMMQHTRRKKMLSVVIVSLILAACSPAFPEPTPAPSPTPGPLEIINALNSAINRGDTDAALDLFVDGELEYAVAGEYATDKEGLRYCLDYLATGANPQDTITGCQSEAEKVTCIRERYGECLLGFDALHVQMTFVFQDHKIRGMFGDVVSDQKAAFEAAVADMFGWLSENDPELGWEYESAYTASDRSGRKVGELVVEICREYMEASEKEAAMAVMDQFYEAWNAYDVESMLALQTDDAVWTLVDPGKYHPALGPEGKRVGSSNDEIRAMFDLHRRELGATGYALWTEVDGDTVRATELWESDYTHEIDVPIISRSSYVLRDGKIAEWVWSCSPESTRRLIGAQP